LAAQDVTLLSGQVGVIAQDNQVRLGVAKLAKTAERAFTAQALLSSENRTLFAQNNEKKSRQSARSTVIGKAKVMSYEDIVVARQKRKAKTAARMRNCDSVA
jgi:hypothetical protein